MKILLTGFSLFFFGTQSSYAANTIDVPSDSARYTLVKITKVDEQFVEITTKRNGKSGESYSKRLVDCNNSKFKYLGSGDTLKQMENNPPSKSMGLLVNKSISYYISTYACNWLNSN